MRPGCWQTGVKKMNWNETFGPGHQPEMKDIEAFTDCPYWKLLTDWLKEEYAALYSIEYSSCSGKPGWNVKYRKGGRRICTLYPDKEYLTCLVSIGGKEADHAEFILTSCTPYVRNMYRETPPLNGGRWLMIEVSDRCILEDVKKLIDVRMRRK